jgi:hypothetical protein
MSRRITTARGKTTGGESGRSALAGKNCNDFNAYSAYDGYDVF